MLLGSNGSGKTTLLRCLAGVMRPDSGTVTLFGWPLDRRPSTRSRIGFVAHESRLYEHLTIQENLLFAARMSDVARPRQRVQQMLEESNLIDWARALPRQLSRGMLRRAAIVRALIHEPTVWLLDEPAAGIDDQGAQWLTALIERHCDRGGCCLVATHRPECFASIANRQLVLGKGRLASRYGVRPIRVPSRREVA